MKFTEAIKKYLALLVGIDLSLALTVGYYYPEIEELKVILPVLLFVMLYPMMINLKIESIGKSAKAPKPMLIAMGLNFLITPLLGALWAHYLLQGTDSYLSAGFILKIVVPCSGMAAAWTGYAKGRVETALVIVALSFILAIFMVPFWMWALASSYVQIDVMMFIEKLILIVVLPLVAGLATRKLLIGKIGKEKYQRIAPSFPAISTLGMLTMAFLIIAGKAVLILDNLDYVVLVMIGIATLYPLHFLISLGISKAFHMDFGDTMAIAYSVTAKNHAITIGIAVTAFGGTLAVLPAAVAPLIQIPLMMGILALAPRLGRTFKNIEEDVAEEINEIRTDIDKVIDGMEKKGS